MERLNQNSYINKNDTYICRLYLFIKNKEF